MSVQSLVGSWSGLAGGWKASKPEGLLALGQVGGPRGPGLGQRAFCRCLESQGWVVTSSD